MRSWGADSPSTGLCRMLGGWYRHIGYTFAISRTWVRRKWLPDGSRKPASMPYGRSSGVSVNSTPAALSSS